MIRADMIVMMLLQVIVLIYDPDCHPDCRQVILLRSTSTLSHSSLYCYYDTGDVDSVYTTYFIDSVVNIISSSNNNDNHISTSQLMFEQLLIAFQQ